MFDIISNPQIDSGVLSFNEEGKYPYFTRSVLNNGFLGNIDFFDNEHLIKGNVISVGMMGMHFFYVKDDFYAGQFTKRLVPKFKGFNEKLALYFISILNRYSYVLKDMLVRYFDKTVGKIIVSLPLTSSGDINYSYMEERITELEEERITELDSYLKVSGLGQL